MPKVTYMKTHSMILGSSIALLFLAACHKNDSTSTEQTLTTSATAQAQVSDGPNTGSAQVGGPAGQPAGQATVGHAPATEPPRPPATAAAAVANQDKKVAAATGPNGSSMDLDNGKNKGSVSTGNGVVKIQGTAGAIAVPTGGGLPKVVP